MAEPAPSEITPGIHDPLRTLKPTGKRSRQQQAPKSPDKRQRCYKSSGDPATTQNRMDSSTDFNCGTARAERELASIYNLDITTPLAPSTHLRQSRIRAIHEALQAAGGAEDDEARGYTLRLIEALDIELDAPTLSYASAARAATP